MSRLFYVESAVYFSLIRFSPYSTTGPEKRPRIPSKVVDEGGSRFRIEFTTVEVGSYVVDVTVAGGLTVPSSPLIAKAYDAGLIKVTDIQDGLVGELSTFRGDIKEEVTQINRVSIRFVSSVPGSLFTPYLVRVLPKSPFGKQTLVLKAEPLS